MASQAFSASANVLKGDPPIRMAVLLKLMGRQEATKPGCPWSPGPLRLSLLITNEKPLSLALHISSSSVAGAMRLKCRAILRSRQPLNGSSLLEAGAVNPRRVFFRWGFGARTGSHIRFISRANRSIALPFFLKLDVESDAGQTGERRGILIGLVWVGPRCVSSN
jgi:hypothetical protein